MGETTRGEAVTLLDGKSRFVYLVYVQFGSQEQEDSWNRWYEEKHIPELLSVPGFLTASRFQQRGYKHRYLAVYEIDSPGVFEEPRYEAVRGWGEWEPYIVEWRSAVYGQVEPKARQGGEPA